MSWVHSYMRLVRAIYFPWVLVLSVFLGLSTVDLSKLYHPHDWQQEVLFVANVVIYKCVRSLLIVATCAYVYFLWHKMRWGEYPPIS